MGSYKDTNLKWFFTFSNKHVFDLKSNRRISIFRLTCQKRKTSCDVRAVAENNENASELMIVYCVGGFKNFILLSVLFIRILNGENIRRDRR